MKQSEELFRELTEKFSNNKKRTKHIISEELGGIVTLKPLVQLTSEDFNSNKQPWETKFEAFVNEEKSKSLEAIVNNDMKTNTLEQEGKIKSDSNVKFTMDNKLGGSYKVSDAVENIESHNYDYKAENINNINTQELLTGVQLEIKYNSALTLDEAKELAIKNLTKDPLHYVKEGQFGIKGLGYTEQKVDINDGETYGGSGYSTKLKKSSEALVPVKESKNQKISRLIKESLNGPRAMEEDFDKFDEAKDKAIEASQEKAGIKEEDKPDFMDIDDDGDKEESMKKAGRDKKAKKPKKETIDFKLSEIAKQGDIVKLEAQINYLDEIIEEKSNRLSSIDEDENLSELVDKKKMKEMQREVKLLDKKKAQMEKLYEKMCGTKYSKPEMVDEMDGDDFEDEDERENYYLNLDSVDEAKK